jgi:hypothetical protein
LARSTADSGGRAGGVDKTPWSFCGEAPQSAHSGRERRSADLLVILNTFLTVKAFVVKNVFEITRIYAGVSFNGPEGSPEYEHR